jgi:transcriptional regulator with PAS, ATPase and Fis domain
MSLALHLKKPMFVLRAEHWFDAFSDIASCSAPIFDNNHNLSGVLSIGTFHHKYINSLTFSLVTTFASLIQKQYQLALFEEMIRATQKISDEALVALDNRGYITYFNDIAADVFHLRNARHGRVLEEVFGEQPEMRKALKKGRVANINMDIQSSGLWSVALQPMKDRSGNVFGSIGTLRRQTQTAAAEDAFAGIVFRSRAMAETIARAKKVAVLEENVLLEGESGCGKELFARAIHQMCRPGRPFIAVNCGALPRSIVESELFGYEGGAFTGAERQGRKGKIEQAAGGTLFLDEIGDMPPEIQPVLLRVLEDRTVIRLGGHREVKVDFLLIAATNRTLNTCVSEGIFRADVYYRLAGFLLRIPPLRERAEDIPLLCRHYLRRFAVKTNGRAPTLSSAVKSMFLAYDWPGNVRQLENCVMYAALMCRAGIIRPEDLPHEIRTFFANRHSDAVAKGKKGAIDHSDILMAMKETGGNATSAAALLGISRATLYRKMKHITPPPN